MKLPNGDAEQRDQLSSVTSLRNLEQRPEGPSAGRGKSSLVKQRQSLVSKWSGLTWKSYSTHEHTMELITLRGITQIWGSNPDLALRYCDLGDVT